MTGRHSRLVNERYLHLAFDISVWVKGVDAVIEILGGGAAFFASHQLIVEIAAWLTQGELAEDPHDVIANYLMHAARHLSIGTQHFTAIYLISHGVIKLWLVVGLLRERLWYYPTALVVFSLFIVYQLYRYSATHSLWLIFITVVDLIVIVLTWHEYGYLRRRKGAA